MFAESANGLAIVVSAPSRTPQPPSFERGGCRLFGRMLSGHGSA
jgi:hypothetical protein